MRSSREEASCSTDPGNNSANRCSNDIDLVSVVKALHGLSSQELGEVIRDADLCPIAIGRTSDEFDTQIDAEKLARYLPLHLIAVIIDSEWDEVLVQYLLSGMQLLYSLCDLAPRRIKIEKILLDDVRVSEQLIDLIFYLLTVLAACNQEYHASNDVVHLHSALVASTLSLLTGCISSQLPEVSKVLLAYYKVDVFMDVAFAAVRINIKYLQTRLLPENADFCRKSNHTAEQKLNHLFQQCEASLQFLQLLSQQKLFRERLLKNKELCSKGGVILLAQAVLMLNTSPSFAHSSAIIAAVSRMKARVLSILLHLCEAESISYLDEVASNPGSLDLAKSITLKVLELLKKMFGRETTQQTALPIKMHPKGQLQLNAMRIVEIFADDSNFRSYIMTYFTKVLAAVFLLPHGEFLSSWCSSELPDWEKDTTFVYDPWAAARWALGLFEASALDATTTEPILVPSNIPQASYAHKRTSLLIKVIANLHCHVPHLCKEEKDLFLRKFYDFLKKGRPKLPDGFSTLSDAEKASIVSKNLYSLLSHAKSLPPGFLNDDDVQLLRFFISQLESLLKHGRVEVSQVQEIQGKGGFSSLHIKRVAPGAEQSNFRINISKQSPERCRIDKSKDNTADARDAREPQKDIHIVETSGSDSSSVRGKNPVDHQMEDVDPAKESGLAEIKGDEKVEEKNQKKRKRTLMNEKQIAIMERALTDEPDMHRNANSLLFWAGKLSAHGSDVTTAQLKNWLNNRKARMLRVSKDSRPVSEADIPDKQGGSASLPSHDSISSRSDGVCVPSSVNGSQPSGTGDDILRAHSIENSGMLAVTSGRTTHVDVTNYGPGQFVSILDKNSKDIGTGKVYQVDGSWFGKELKQSGTCVVDITELRVDRLTELPYPSEITSCSFDQAEKGFGLMRILWDSNRLALLPSRVEEEDF